MIRAVQEIAAWIAVYSLAVFPILVIHCFYDERITLSRRKSAIFALIPVLFKISEIYPASDIPLMLLLITVIPITAVIGEKMRFYHRFVNWSRYVFIFLFSLFGLWVICEAITRIICYIFNVGAESADPSIPVFLLIPGGASLIMYASYIRKNKVLMFRKQDKVIVWVYSVFLFAIMIMFTDTAETPNSFQPQNSHDVIFLFSLLFIVIFIPIFLVKNCQSSFYGRLSEHQQYFLEAELNASKQYKTAQEETRAFRHDVQNNLTAVSMLMEQGKYDEAKQYIDDMRTDVSSFSPKVITGDEMLDSIVSAKLVKMNENRIKFTINGVIDGGLGWKPMDICTVFANALDNAIEASSQTSAEEKRFITLSIKKTDHQRLIRLENSCGGDIDCEFLLNDNLHFTSKKDKGLHGFGIRNMKKVIEKNGGMMKINCKNKRFTLDMILSRNTAIEKN